jgi:putative flippase GtrA
VFAAGDGTRLESNGMMEHTDSERTSAASPSRPGIARATWRRTLEFRRYLTVGLGNTLLDYFLFIALTKILRLPLELVWIAKVISGTVAISISFYLNRTWVFRASGAPMGQAAKFVTTTVVGVYAIQTPLTHIFSSVVPEPGLAVYDALARTGLTDALGSVLTEAFVVKSVAFVLATVPTIVFNFLLYRLWVFPAKEGRQPA